MNEITSRFLPPEDAQRRELHNEVHARPPARVRLPALIVYVALLNEGVTREQEWAHLRLLPGHADLGLDQLQGNFLRLRCDHFTVKWERHTEFTRYSIVQNLPPNAQWGADLPDLAPHVAVGTDWLRALPGQTMAAIELGMLPADIDSPHLIAQAQSWLGEGTVLASRMGNTAEGLSHSCILTHFRIGADGFERMLVVAPENTSEARAGRISQRLLELETYRLMALRGLPVAKNLSAMLSSAESQLADITGLLERKGETDQALLDLLVSLAARIERATAEHGFRFSATRAYDTLVSQRLTELRERPISGTQTLGEFMQRRLSPAMATVMATEKRLASLAERVSRTSALLRTRVDIATEAQNQVLLEKLTRGQELQLRLQVTVEGLSMAAISYYVVSLLLYAFKGLKAYGLPFNPEMAVALMLPLVLWSVWRSRQKSKKNCTDRTPDPMELRQLRYFVRVVELGSISRAALDLNLVQSALSQQITRLEGELSTRLLQRSPQGVTPTEAGVAFFREAQLTLRHAEQAIRAAQQARLSGTVSVGLAPTTAAVLGLPLMQAMRERYPDVRLHMVESLSGHLSAMLNARQLDLAVLFDLPMGGGQSLQAARRWSVLPLIEEDIFLISARITRAKKSPQSLRMSQLCDEPLILPTGPHGLRSGLNAAFSRAKVDPRVIMEMDSLAMLMDAVSAGLGSTLQPWAAVARMQGATETLCMTRITDHQVKRVNFLCGLSDEELSPAALATRVVLADCARTLVRSGVWLGASLSVPPSSPEVEN